MVAAEHGVEARKSRPDGGDEDARPASEAAAALLVGVEEQHAALEVGAEEADVLVAEDGSLGKLVVAAARPPHAAPLLHGY
jgi:hypothetical protein